ncbi:MAG: phosphoribosylformylglycinamidine synthase I [Candidatus Delongbacteria bacterium]|nr:MAG: phosphoribosylformylglycinamidine synthase I [Candidatus Delongbacteria bacterium]
MKLGVVIFPGSNCDHDMLHVLKTHLSPNTIELWHKDTTLQNCDGIFLPGGFSYGDYLRSGAIARFSPIMNEIIKFANNGGFVFGICNGFQILCEAGLLPGTLMHNDNRKFICKNSFIRPENTDTAVNLMCQTNKAYKIPIAHGEGKYFADAETLASIEANNQIIFRYCNSQGEITEDANPNGSIKNIAGVCNKNKNVFGMMPHPERAAAEELKNTDGVCIFKSILKFLEKN